jgi:subtilisin family serine protease
MVGTAPEAHYYLLRSEVSGEEFPVEEDYWVAALEYADSLGVDIVNSSLGYNRFDDSRMDHRWADLDGQTAAASRAASMAAAKGMAIFLSVGNMGEREWQKVSVPADAENILTVGAVGRDSICAAFSSWGSVEGRMKPDVMAMGEGVYVFHPLFGVTEAAGTSFAAPILAGAGACLWGAFPSLTAVELMALIRRYGDRSDCPDPHYGYGIPDMGAAYLQINQQDGYSYTLTTE